MPDASEYLSMTIRWLVVLLGVSISAALTRGADTSAYDPDDFVISYWCNPPVRFNTLERYKEIKEANFTVAMRAGGAGYTVEQNRQMLDYCRQVGLKAIIADGRMPFAIGGNAAATAGIDGVVKDYADHPALLAYYIVDEPGAGAYPGLGEVVAYLKQKDPRHPGYINLLPAWARDLHVLGTNTYEEYVRKFVEQVKPSLICYDNYQFTKAGDRGDWFENLATVRKVALEAKIPFWNIVLAVEHGGYRNLTEPELRYEAMHTVAFGARGLLWFTYWSPKETDNSATWDHAIINADGSRDAHYDMVKKINADVLAITKELRGAESVAVYEPPAKPTNDPITPADSPIRVTADPLTIGVFKRSDGKHFALLASRDYKKPTNARISLRDGGPDGVRGGEQFDAATRAWSPLQNAHELPAGGALLVRW
jgi:hypothetical protein